MESHQDSKLQYRKRKRSQKLYSIDVLTDGSEETGSPCLFLSLWGASVDTSHGSSWWEGSPKARYALDLGSDTCSRLATDQRYKLAATKAVFSDSLWGWKALQLALQRAGAGQIHLVTSHPNVEKIVERRGHQCPMVHLCDLSELSDSVGSANETQSVSWWQVYEDENLLVHAKAIHLQPGGSASRWAFLYTVRSHYTREEKSPQDLVSFLVLPRGTRLANATSEYSKNLPVVDNKPLRCNFLVALQPTGVASCCDVPLFIVKKNEGLCGNLLVRARQQAEAWHAQCPRYFPLTKVCATGLTFVDPQEERLRTGTSLYWWDDDDASQLVFRRQDRMAALREKALEVTSASDIGSTAGRSPPRHTWPATLKEFLQSPVPCRSACDDNEIDLDEITEDEDDNDNKLETNRETDARPELELFCLGTGCAAPSAYRGASAYLIRGAQECGGPSLHILLEAGEGFVTQYQRHVSSNMQSLLHISLIWVSHAHWDHYGGLVPLLDVMRRERLRRGANGGARAPLVMGPRAVLRFCEHMLHQKEEGEWFYGIAHEDKCALGRALDCWNKNHDYRVAFWENVLVDHSCRNSYGCIFGVRIRASQHFTFAFSGDTRPCRHFVQACRHQGRNGEIDFLLHEATFDDEEKEMSIKKKHSTVREAIQIGRDVGATRVLLSHFSQRYDSLPNIPENASTRVGFALDGMRLDLS